MAARCGARCNARCGSKGLLLCLEGGPRFGEAEAKGAVEQVWEEVISRNVRLASKDGHRVDLP